MNRDPGSFRDRDGFTYYHEGEVYRQINKSYAEDYKLLMASGLYERLTRDGLLIPHEEVEPSTGLEAMHYRTIQPERVDFISYPYEWSFSQLKAAALATLEIAFIALEHNMALKDASAYNIQFHKGRPVFIDTLSFERYTPGAPWPAYRQFCKLFLAPLTLASKRDVGLLKMLATYIDGIPLELVAKLLPKSCFLAPTRFFHIWLHAKAEAKYAGETKVGKTGKFSCKAHLGMLDSLKGAVESLVWGSRTEWGKYYEDTNYAEKGMAHKKELVRKYAENTGTGPVWDLGANTGLFTRLAAQGRLAVAFDVDYRAVDDNYRSVVKNGEKNILPLVQDLTNPSTGMGWANAERKSLAGRGPADLCLVLALVHHICIANNVPLKGFAQYLSTLCRHLIIEFVPKSDSQVARLLVTRKDIFSDYTRENFVAAFGSYFDIVVSEHVTESERTLYKMENKR